MNVLCPNINYDCVIKRLEHILIEEKIKGSIILYGAGFTGRVIAAFLKKMGLNIKFFIDQNSSINCIDGIDVYTLETAKVDEQDDSIILTAFPLNYPSMTKSIDTIYPQISRVNLLNDEILRTQIEEIQFIERRDKDEKEIGLVVESQPRAGTNWLVQTVADDLNGGFGYNVSYSYYRPPITHSIFEDIEYPESDGPSIIFTHFFKPINYHLLNKTEILYLLTFPLDSYYSWSFLSYRQKYNRTATEQDPYFLKEENIEWQWCKTRLKHNLDWLLQLPKDQVLRYEDWFQNPEKNKNIIRNLVPQFKGDGIKIRDNSKRLYFTKQYSKKMEKKVFDFLLSFFEPAIKMYWPECLNASYQSET